MRPVTRSLALRFLGERGATAGEYGLMIALIAMVMIGSLFLLGPRLSAVFDKVAGSVATPAPARPPAPGPGAPPSVHYDDCDAVRAAGADPIREGDPGYSLELDPDGDGVGCETP